MKKLWNMPISLGSWISQKLLVLLLAISLVIGGCNLAPPAQSRNQIAIGVLSDPKTFNPALNAEAANIFTYTTEGMVVEDGRGQLVPALAESWQIKGNSITFKLRPNLQWSDGEPLTVDDVLFSFNEVYLNPEIPSNSQDVLRIGKAQKFPTVQKVSDREVQITTPEPFAPALRTIGGIGILPAHKLRQAVRTIKNGKSQFLTTWGTDTPPHDLVSNGMYQLDSYVVGERLVFKRNPHYWRKDARGRQLPYVDRLIWQLVESGDTALMQFRSQNTDVYGVSPFFFSLLKREEKKGDFTIHNLGPDTGTTFMAFNLNKGSRKGTPLIDPVKSKWFNEVKFRQAVAYAIDRQRMIDNIYRGLGAPQNSPISVGTPYYRAPQPAEVYDYNPTKAKQLLQSVGFKYNKNGQLLDSQDNRVRFTLNVPAEGKIAVALGTQIKQDLSQIGMEVNFEPIAFSSLVDKLDIYFDWDAHIISFTGGIEPNEGANFWLVDGRSHVFNQTPSKKQDPVTGQEIAPWEKEINDLYIQGAQELNEARRKEIYGKTQQITQANLPCIYLVNSLSLSAIRNRIKGTKPSSIGGSLWNLYELKIQE